MQLTYRFDQANLKINEIDMGTDTEFEIQILNDGPLLRGIKEIHKAFDENKDYTDVMFYIYEHHQYKVIVRKDYYSDFVLALMKHKLLLSVEWV
ncbi:MAG: hypothetical protein H7X86_02995 [Gorillibacterium sp.]|nr:hypothetical protein [Gorillibacterium sp.]